MLLARKSITRRRARFGHASHGAYAPDASRYSNCHNSHRHTRHRDNRSMQKARAAKLCPHRIVARSGESRGIRHSQEAADATTATTIAAVATAANAAARHSGIRGKHPDRGHGKQGNQLFTERAHVPFSLSRSLHRSLPGPVFRMRYAGKFRASVASGSSPPPSAARRHWPRRRRPCAGLAAGGLTLLNTLRLQDRASANRLLHLKGSARRRTTYA